MLNSTISTTIMQITITISNNTTMQMVHMININSSTIKHNTISTSSSNIRTCTRFIGCTKVSSILLTLRIFNKVLGPGV